MAGMFDTYRRHKKLVFSLLLLAMVLFLVGSNLLSQFGSRAEDRDTAVATWKYGTIRNSDLGHTIAELNMLNRVRGQIQRMYTGQEMNIPSASPEMALHRIVLSKKADAMGIEVSKANVQQWIKRYTYEIPTVSLQEALAKTRISEEQFFQAMQHDAKVDRVTRLLGGGLDNTPPAESFATYLHEKQQLTAEAVAVPVAEYMAEKSNKDDKILKQFFDLHKEKFAVDGEPGFRRPYEAQFQFFLANIADFVPAVEGQITDEAVKDYYEKNRDNFKELDLPKDDKKETDPKQDAEKKEADKDKKEPEKKDATVTPEPEKKDAEKNDAAKKDAAKKDAEKSPFSEGDEKGMPKLDPTPKTEIPKTDDKSSDANRERLSPSAVKLVSFNVADESKTDELKTDEDKNKLLFKEEKSVDEKKADDKKATENKTDDGKPAPEKPAPAKPSEPDTNLLDNKKIDDVKNVADEIKAKTKYKTLDQVKGEIRRGLARSPAVKNATAALDKANSTVTEYSTKRAIWSSNKLIGKEEPEPLAPSFADIAKNLGLLLGHTEMASFPEFVKKNPLSRFYLPESGVAFANKAYSHPMTEYTPVRITDGNDNLYSIWLTKDRKEVVPTFEEAKADVIKADLMIDARKKAQQEAERLVALAKKKPADMLEEVFASESGKKSIKIGPFSWKSQQGFGNNARLVTNDIPGIEEPGNEFMRGVYALEIGETGIAWNQTKTMAYVVRPSATENLPAVYTVNFLYGKKPSYENEETMRSIGTKWFAALEEDIGLKRDKSFGQRGGSESAGLPVSSSDDD